MQQHPSITAILPHFGFEHLPPHLREVSQPIGELAHALVKHLDGRGGPELAAGLRKLLEAKDCFVRAALRPGGPTKPAAFVLPGGEPVLASQIIAPRTVLLDGRFGENGATRRAVVEFVDCPDMVNRPAQK